MAISWNEIRSRAMAFSNEWATESSEDAEAQSFWNDFFNIFGVTRRRVAAFEKSVKKQDGKDGYIDLLWQGVLLVEHKSRGKSLERAAHQAFDYFPGLKEHQLPRFVLVSDFAKFRLYDLDDNQDYVFSLEDLHKHVRKFAFIAGYEVRDFGVEDPVNIRAVQALGKLHDQLKASGYDGQPLEILLVRLLFCLFAQGTSIFEQRYFSDWIEHRTAEDGSDLGQQLTHLFQVLDTPHEKRSAKLEEMVSKFEYVNGKLFRAVLPIASFDTEMRETLLSCGALNWSRISPAIFGSLFQCVLDANARREAGAHYTTETNILKALRPLFLDSLHADFEKAKHNQKALQVFHARLTKIRIMDPACGCGNFLVVAYRELRLLELDVLRTLEELRHSQHFDFDLSNLVQVDVDQLYGIEYEEFPAQIAQVALWLTDHQLNLLVSEQFGKYFVRLPLKKAPNIVHENALRTNWADVLPPDSCSYLVGNPPFVGKAYQSAEQKADLAGIFSGVAGSKVLDYVACWYKKAAAYMVENPSVVTAFVSTNSITQGEQPGILWPELYRYGAKIHFAHRTFQWMSETPSQAAVHCVIIGFALFDISNKVVFEYDTARSNPHELKVSNINPYLVEGTDFALSKRRNHFQSSVPKLSFGSMPNDDGNLIVENADKAQFLAAEPNATNWLRPIVGSDEFINALPRWCLWLVDIKPTELRAMPEVMKRVEAVREIRLRSPRETTNALAATPTLFGEMRQPTVRYFAVPKTSSESRSYIPMGYLEPDVVANTEIFTLPGASLFHTGILMSLMHMAWTRSVCGRLKSDYRYSAGIVYNNFPWPVDPTEVQIAAIGVAAEAVFKARADSPTSTYADMYDPLSMPPELTKAHNKLNKVVDAAYGKKGFATEAARVAYLFQLYQTQTSLLPAARAQRRSRALATRALP